VSGSAILPRHQAVQQLKEKPNLILSDPSFDFFDAFLNLYVLLLLTFDKVNPLYELLAALAARFPENNYITIYRQSFSTMITGPENSEASP